MRYCRARLASAGRDSSGRPGRGCVRLVGDMVAMVAAHRCRGGGRVTGCILPETGFASLAQMAPNWPGAWRRGACLADLGLSTDAAAQSRDLKSLRKMRRFAEGMARAFPWPAQMVRDLPDETVLCRCEGGDCRRTASHGSAIGSRCEPCQIDRAGWNGALPGPLLPACWGGTDSRGCRGFTRRGRDGCGRNHQYVRPLSLLSFAITTMIEPVVIAAQAAGASPHCLPACAPAGEEKHATVSPAHRRKWSNARPPDRRQLCRPRAAYP